MATIDTDLATRLETGADRAADELPLGPDAWPSNDLASRRTAVAAQPQGEPEPVTGPTSEEPEPMSMPEPMPQPTAVPPPALMPALSSIDARKPAKLLADLATAMRSTAIAARDQALAQVEQEAAASVNALRANSVTTAKALRHHADDDVNGIREWSKAEIQRVRTETEERIVGRRKELDEHLAAQAAAVEQRVFDVQDSLARYQAEMAAFFERLVAESDPARLATMAETMPEPPALAVVADLPPGMIAVAIDAGAADETETPTRLGTEPDPDDVGPGYAASASAVADDPVSTTAVAAPELEQESEAVPAAEPEAKSDATALADDAGVPAAERAEARADDGEPAGEAAPHDESRSFAGRLASLLPHRSDDAAEVEPQTTQVIVTGLASVASIASFKRHLGRVAGVASVAVSSGPDGEFVFAAAHRPGFHLADAIPGLPGFAASVTRTGEGVLFVAANDPDAEAEG